MEIEANSKASTTPQVTVLTDILEWSKSRHPWIREALRMLVTQPQGLSEADIVHLANICKKEAGITTEDIQANWFSEKHIAVHCCPAKG